MLTALCAYPSCFFLSPCVSVQIKLVLMHPERSPAAWEGRNSSNFCTRHGAKVLPVVVIVLGCAASAIGVGTTVQKLIKGESD